MRIATLKIDNERIHFNCTEPLGFREVAYAAYASYVRYLFREGLEKSVDVQYNPSTDFVSAGKYTVAGFQPAFSVKVGLEGSEVMEFFQKASLTFVFLETSCGR